MEIRKNVLVEVTDEDIIDGKFIIPDNVIEIVYLAFYRCQTLKEVIASNVRKVGRYAFYNMPLLERVDISNAKEIANRGFTDCPKLREVIISEVDYIEFSAFLNCPSLHRPSDIIRKEVYDKALIYLEEYKNFGLCRLIGEVIYYFGNKYKIALSAECVFPRFTYENAKKNFGAGKKKDDYWWPLKNREIRKEFLKWCYEDFKL